MKTAVAIRRVESVEDQLPDLLPVLIPSETPKNTEFVSGRATRSFAVYRRFRRSPVNNIFSIVYREYLRWYATCARFLDGLLGGVHAALNPGVCDRGRNSGNGSAGFNRSAC